MLKRAILFDNDEKGKKIGKEQVILWNLPFAVHHVTIKNFKFGIFFPKLTIIDDICPHFLHIISTDDCFLWEGLQMLSMKWDMPCDSTLPGHNNEHILRLK